MAKKKAKITKQTTVKNSSLPEAIIKGIQELKGQNIVWLDLSHIPTAVCQQFIICEGTATTQVNAIADSIKEVVKKETKEIPFHSEGYENSQWILIDFVTVVVHIFLPEVREYYNLEDLWADAKVVELKEK